MFDSEKENGFIREKAERIQVLVRRKLVFSQLGKEPSIIGAVDAAYPDKKRGVGVAVLGDSYDKSILEIGISITRIHIPYIPGFLAFRELSPMMSSINLLSRKPDLLLVDGHGFAHPRLAGIASHIGVVFEVPTIGVAKKKLVGNIVIKNGDECIYYHNKKIGAVLSVPKEAKKLFISVGNMITLNEALRIIRLLRPNRGLPFPLNYADRLSKEVARNIA